MEMIVSRRNPLCLHIRRLGASRGYRQQCGEFLCDGGKLLEEALKEKAQVVAVLGCKGIPLPQPDGVRVCYADRDLIDYLSPLKNAQGVLFTCKVPKEQSGHAPGTHILLDGLQDPGNVGAIIRTADAFGIKSVILACGCADPYNPKAVRASMGAVFRQKIRHAGYKELKKLKEEGVRFVAAAPGSSDISGAEIKGSIIAIGSEGGGLCPEVLCLCDERVWIPLEPGRESLNAAVAAGIIIWSVR